MAHAIKSGFKVNDLNLRGNLNISFSDGTVPKAGQVLVATGDGRTEWMYPEENIQPDSGNVLVLHDEKLLVINHHISVNKLHTSLQSLTPEEYRYELNVNPDVDYVIEIDHEEKMIYIGKSYTPRSLFKKVSKWNIMYSDYQITTQYESN